MIAAEPYLKTQRVAQSLGVSVSTIKRWVDSGAIRAARTVGKHRLIPRSEALRLAREKGFSPEKIETLAGLGSSQSHRVGDVTRETLRRLLVEGKAQEARFLVDTLYSAGCSAPSLADDLIRPVMQQIGHGWFGGVLDIYQEHAATQIVASALMGLIDRVGETADVERPLALLAAPEGDPYVLPGLVCELTLLEMGWRTHHLGVNLPLLSLANATLQQWPRLICISVSYVLNEDRFVSEYDSFQEAAAATNAAVILGGSALTPELRSRLLLASFGDRMSHLSEFARQIVPNRSQAFAEEKASLGGDTVT